MGGISKVQCTCAHFYGCVCHSLEQHLSRFVLSGGENTRSLALWIPFDSAVAFLLQLFYSIYYLYFYFLTWRAIWGHLKILATARNCICKLTSQKWLMLLRGWIKLLWREVLIEKTMFFAEMVSFFAKIFSKFLDKIVFGESVLRWAFLNIR